MSDSDDRSARRSGGCQCGAVRFAVTGAPEEVSVCDCRMCQKASGGPFMSMGRFPSGAVTWTRGQPATFRSSAAVTRGFCVACGTPLTYQRRPEALSLLTGTFDEPGTLVPTVRLGADTILPWTDRLADLPVQTIDDWLSGMPDDRHRFASLQHPDHDT
jgi:hypothetical protein